jgi:RNA ligase (TIGR02306 family)
MWQTVVRKGEFKEGDRVIYFPPDTVLIQEVSDNLGVTNYLSHGGRVKSIKLRGEYSHGFVIKTDVGFIDDNAAEYFKATKYEPPIRMAAEDQEKIIHY